jgi:hypothetical protein
MLFFIAMNLSPAGAEPTPGRGTAA